MSRGASKCDPSIKIKQKGGLKIADLKVAVPKNFVFKTLRGFARVVLTFE